MNTPKLEQATRVETCISGLLSSSAGRGISLKADRVVATDRLRLWCRSALAVLPLIPLAVVLSSATRGTAGDSLPSGPAPAPYEDTRSRQDWRTPDGRHLAVCILGLRGEDRGRALAVYDSSSVGWRQVFLDDDRGFHPWALEIGEVDGDPLPEVVVAVYKATRFDPLERNRVFVFDWTEQNDLFAKWLGSRLGPSIERFALAPGPDGRDRLFVRASAPDGCVRSYAWNGFGFDFEAEVPLSEAPASLSDDPPNSSTPPANLAGQ